MKTFLSIGSGPGMGSATAERFAKEGFQIILSARNATKTQELADELKAKGYTVAVRTVDASDPSSVASLISNVENEFGPIDVLHYNAASMRKATILEQPRDTFTTDLAVNIGGALVAAQAVVPKMSERGSGSILLTGGLRTCRMPLITRRSSTRGLLVCRAEDGARSLPRRHPITRTNAS